MIESESSKYNLNMLLAGYVAQPNPSATPSPGPAPLPRLIPSLEAPLPPVLRSTPMRREKPSRIFWGKSFSTKWTRTRISQTSTATLTCWTI